MHEYSLAQEMASLITRALKGPRELARVTVVIGPLSGVSPESLAFCFPEVASEWGLGHPELAVRKTSAEMICSQCAHGWESDDFTAGCPACGSWERRIVSGREFFVETVEYDQEDSDEDIVTCHEPER